MPDLYLQIQAYGGGDTSDSPMVDNLPEPTLATPTVSATQVGGNAVFSIGYTPGENDALEGFLVYIGASATPDWGGAADVGTDTSPSLPNALTGVVYYAVRAYGAGLTADSDVGSYFIAPPVEPTVPSELSDWAPAMAGETLAGGMPILGELANLNGVSAGRESVTITWAHKDGPEATPVRVQWYANGYPAADGYAAEGVVGITGLEAEIDHRLEHVLLPMGAEVPERILNARGNRAAIHWTPSSDTTTRAYRIYRMAGSPELLAEITEQRVQERVKQQPDSGTGHGRITTFGAVPTGTEVNGTMELEVLESGMIQWTWNGEASGEFDFVPGSATTLMHGLVVVCDDPPAAYDPGDTWTVHIGPATEYVTDTLAPGDYTFGVSAMDAAGNESGIVSGGGMRVVAIPAPLDPDSVVFEYDAGELTVTWAVPSGAAGVRVFANWNPHTGTFTDHIITNGRPLAEVVAPANSWTFDPNGTEGELMFYLRPYDAEDEREDITLHAFNFPPNPEDWGVVLGSPSALRARAVADGKWLLEWAYRLRTEDDDGDPVEDDIQEFRVYKSAADTPIDYENDLLATVAADDSTTAPPVLNFAYTHTTPDSEPVRLAVRASDGSIEDTNTDYVVVTPDATAPTFAGPVWGGPA